MTFAKINGQNLFFKDSLSGATPIIMMHGFLMDQSLFEPQVNALPPTFRCIRFDARGFGLTEWDQSAFTLYDTVSDCIGLMNFLAIESAVIMGMSQGGYAALRLAFNHPERVKALVLMSTQASIDDAATLQSYSGMRDTWVNHGPVDPLVEGLATALLGQNSNASMNSMWNQWIPKWKQVSANAIFHAMNSLMTRDDVSNKLDLIKHPTLITHGEEDIGMPIVHGKFLRDHLPNCKGFIPIAGAAHAANYTHPESVNQAILDFLIEIDRNQARATHANLFA